MSHHKIVGRNFYTALLTFAAGVTHEAVSTLAHRVRVKRRGDVTTATDEASASVLTASAIESQ